MKYRVYVKFFSLLHDKWLYAHSERSVRWDEATKACEVLARHFTCEQLYIVDDDNNIVKSHCESAIHKGRV